MAIKPKQKETAQTKKSVVKKPVKKTTVKKTTWKKTTTRPKYNWPAIKQEFFASEFLHVATFLQHKYSTKTAQSGQVKKMTAWWSDEKKKLVEVLQEQALENYETNLKESWDKIFETLEVAHVKWLEDLANMIIKQWEETTRNKIFTVRDKESWEKVVEKKVTDKIIKPYLTHGDIIAILNHIKLEKWQPTQIINDWSQAKQWLEEMKKNKQK